MSTSNKKWFTWDREKKVMLQFAFLIFIILNIVDFIGILSGDLDFFKKLLSWVIIAYVFYFVSFTKIFIGKRLKTYDLLFIVAFSLMSIIKALVLYTISIFGSDPNSYIIFKPILSLIASLPIALFLYVTFMIGFIMTIILSINLLINYRPEKDSLIGSLNIKDGYFKYVIEQVTLIIAASFFGMILFNLFMEWFALAVDSLLLVIGLFYYFYIDLRKHKNESYIKEVANTGNEFYTNLLKLFSNKKTIFIGISFLLTLHAVVDAGVYMVPYTMGAENQLYFNSFDWMGLDHHTPLFNVFDFEDSLLYQDLQNANGDFILIGSIIINYLMNLLFFFSFLLLPFYIFYHNVRDSKVPIPKLLGVIVLASFLYYLFTMMLTGVSPVLSLQSPLEGSSIRGIDIVSSPLTDGLNAYELIVLNLIFLVSLVFISFRYHGYEFFFKKLLLFFILIFFVYYISMFAQNYLQVEYNNLKTDFLELEEHKSNNYETFNTLYTVYSNNNSYTSIRNLRVNIGDREFILRPFSTIKTEQGQIRTANQNHTDFLLLQTTNDAPYYIKVNDINRLYFENNRDYQIQSDGYVIVREGTVNMIHVLGQNHFDIVTRGTGYAVDLNLDERTITNMFYFQEPTAQERLQKIIEYIRLFFTGIFYVFGTIAFIFFYVKKNFLYNRGL